MTGLGLVSGTLSRGGRRAKKEITGDEKQEIREAFDLFDSNKAGKVKTCIVCNHSYGRRVGCLDSLLLD